jgi:hypothetical protein
LPSTAADEQARLLRRLLRLVLRLRLAADKLPPRPTPDTPNTTETKGSADA